MNLSRLFFLLFLTPAIALSQNINDQKNTVIVNAFNQQNGSLLCLTKDASLIDIKSVINQRLAGDHQSFRISDNDIARAVFTSFPCPFSPYRNDLRPAEAKDIEGVWLFPPSSQKLRFRPRSSNWKQHASAMLACEALAYYPGGENRNVQLLGKMPCLFSKAGDMDVSRRNPKVSTWMVSPSNGLLKIERTDVAGHVEEWEVFYVTQAFDFSGVHFNEGDLVQYLRRENGNDIFAATVFRHLVRLH